MDQAVRDSSALINLARIELRQASRKCLLEQLAIQYSAEERPNSNMSTAKARVSVDLQRQIGPIDDRIYSGEYRLVVRRSISLILCLVCRFYGAHGRSTSTCQFSHIAENAFKGRCIYGGLIDDPKHPSPKELLDGNGYRKDVLEALREFDHALVRFPSVRRLRLLYMLTESTAEATFVPTIIGSTAWINGKMVSSKSGQGGMNWHG